MPTSVNIPGPGHPPKERDYESGLDNFGARFDSSNFGRFMSPDLFGGELVNPRTLNKYSYVINNPLNFTDPTGKYVCQDSQKCDSANDKAFEAARKPDLKSDDKKVREAAQSYGDPTIDNKVHLDFTDKQSGEGVK